MKPILVAFVDSDVIISSLISKIGAAYLLLNSTSSTFAVSSQSVHELERVVAREKLSLDALHLMLNKLLVVPLITNEAELNTQYSLLVTDNDDAHIVAGAVAAKARFLITYNLRHYQIAQIKNKLNIIVLKPADYLQYLRSINLFQT